MQLETVAATSHASAEPEEAENYSAGSSIAATHSSSQQCQQSLVCEASPSSNTNPYENKKKEHIAARKRERFFSLLRSMVGMEPECSHLEILEVYFNFILELKILSKKIVYPSKLPIYKEIICLDLF
jgi:hypothetical protein